MQPYSPSRRSLLSAATGVLILPFATALLADTPSRKEYDVVVYGGVPCGIAAAVSAARAGCSVLLIEPTRHVGGLNTSGINTAESEHMLKWTIGGFALEFYERLGKTYKIKGPEYFFESSVAERTFLDLLAEAKVELRFGLRVEQVKKSDARIEAITLNDGSTITGKVFVDAGYEGDLMARAGVEYVWGRESRSDFDEEAAGFRLDKQPRSGQTVGPSGKLIAGISVHWNEIPAAGTGDRKVMNFNFRLCFAKKPEQQAPIPIPTNYDRGRYQMLADWAADRTKANKPLVLTDVLDLYARRNGKYEVNNKQAAVVSLGHFGGQFNYPDADYPTREKIITDHRDYTLGLLHFLATDESIPAITRDQMRGWGLHKDEFKEEGNWPSQLYVREARRMRGAAIVTQKDVTLDRRKEDAIGISSHFIDCHHVQRVALSEKEWANEGRIWRIGQAYQIPYRALTPKPAQCRNLLVPGAASYTHVAYCTLRLESVWMIAGHAAGVAASIAARRQSDVQQIDVTELRKLLADQRQVVDFIPGQLEKCPSLNGPAEF